MLAITLSLLAYIEPSFFYKKLLFQKNKNKNTHNSKLLI